MPQSVVRVARQQQWKGRQIDLPQPLAPGELGLCVDTFRVYIGGDPAYAPAGVNIVGSTEALEVFYILENRVLVVTLSAPISREDLQLQLVNDFPDIDDIFVNDDQTVASFVIPDGLDAAARAAIESNILALAETDAFLTYEITGLVIDAGEQDEASVLASAINRASSGPTLVNIRLNIELNTFIDNDTFITINEGDGIYDPLRFTLPPSASYVDLPNGGLAFGIDESDVFGGEFSLKLDDSGNYYFFTGDWNANANSVTSSGKFSMNGSSTTSPTNLSGQVNFRMEFLAPNSAVLKYRNTFAADVEFAFIIRRFPSVA